jgi:hypothetical protein
MYYHAGIDVSLETANICVVDGAGTVIRELKVEASLEALTRPPGSVSGDARCGSGGIVAGLCAL